jgi:hypothetical protein
MYAQVIAPPRWSTSSFSDAVDTTPAELSILGAHVDRCKGSRGRWFALQCAVDTIHDFVSGRIVTTLLIACAVIGTSAVIF